MSKQPGLLVNRILMPYLIEAVKLVEEGVSIVTIDQAATEFGMPMGPIELADSVGARYLSFRGGGIIPALHMDVPDKLRELVGQGQLGRKPGRGFIVITPAAGANRRRRTRPPPTFPSPNGWFCAC